MYLLFSGPRQLKPLTRLHPSLANKSSDAILVPLLVAAALLFHAAIATASKSTLPDELEMRLRSQRKAVQSGDPAQIINASQKLVARALLELGTGRSRETAYPQALALFRKALSLEDLPQTRKLIADAEARSGERVQIFAADPVDPASSPKESDISKATLTPRQLRQLKLREKRLRRILAIGYNDWGAAEAHEGRYAEALIQFEEAERWDPATPDLMRNLGMAAIKVGDNHEAARALEMAVKHNPQDKLLRPLLAVSQFSVGDYEHAARSFSLVADLALADPNMAYGWAFSLSRSNKLRQSASVLEKLTRQRLSAEMLVSVGRLYTELGDYQQALTCFRKALEEGPAIKNAHDGAGVALMRMNRPAEAIPELQAELKLNPDDVDAQYQLAYALLQLSRKDEAVALLRSLLATHPDHAQARYQLGKEMLDAGQTEEAINNLELAAKLDPDRAYVHYQLQAAYRRARKSGDADRELKLYRQLKERDRQRVSIQGAHEGKPTE